MQHRHGLEGPYAAPGGSQLVVRRETASQTAGPYVHIGLAPQAAGFDIFANNFGNVLVDAQTKGERIRIEGRVFDGIGTVLKDVLIEIWQANAAGKYAHPGDRQPKKKIDPHFRGWGRAATDFDTGVYSFETIKPGRRRGPQRPLHGAARQRLDRRPRHQHRPEHAHLLQRRGRGQRQRRGPEPDRVGAAPEDARRRAPVEEGQGRRAPSTASTSGCRARTRPSSSTSDATRRRRSEMRRAVATVSLSGTLRAKLEAIAAARFDAIELFENDFIHSAAPAKELAAICADLGLAIDLYQPFRDFEGMPDELFAKSLDRAERKFDLMQALGAPLMLVCSNTSPHSLGEPERAAAQLHALAERAAKRNLRIGYEALAWGRHVNRYQQAWGIVERADHPHLGLILDSFHTLSLQDDPAGIASIPGERIFFVQMADAPILAMDVLQWARHFRNFPGQGQFDVVGFFEQVLRSGYAGTLSLEIFNDVFRETPNRRTAVDAMRSLLWLESEARGRLGARRRSGAARASSVSSSPIRRRATALAGFAFIEFGVDDETAARLDGAAGCSSASSRVGRHRSKQVTLFRQGEILLIVNAEPGSDARERFAEQGACVSAVGVLSDDAPRAVSRATALLSARFDSPLGAGELRLPAMRSPGGMLVHFVPTALGAAGLAAADFVLDDDGSRARRSAGLGRHRPHRHGPRPPTSSTPGSCSAAACSRSRSATASSSPTRSGWFARAASPPPTGACASSSTSRAGR